MRQRILGVVVAACSICCATTCLGQDLSEEDIKKQNDRFQSWFGTDLEWKFAELPEKGTVHDFRVPYSGHIYPDTSGGTRWALSKYDQAFRTGGRAAAWERWDTSAYQEAQVVTRRGGLFGLRAYTTTVMGTPYWHGHCNGWAAATIRHPEPQKSVVRNGVTFSPRDIKALLAEMYIYQDVDMIDGEYALVNPAILHLYLTNWIGRMKRPLAMEADPGKEKWNFPLYSYASTSYQHRPDLVEVRTNLRYAYYSNGEFQPSPRITRDKYFRYGLNLDEEGKITGGFYYAGSSQIDLLWVPFPPVDGGKKGNERGCPHIKVAEIMSIYRDSVEPDMLAKWGPVDPVKPLVAEENEVIVEDSLPGDEVMAIAGSDERSEGATVTADQPAVRERPPLDVYDPSYDYPSDAEEALDN